MSSEAASPPTGEPMIAVRGVSKIYRMWSSPSARLAAPAIQVLARACSPAGSLRQRLEARAQKYYRDFYALHDVSFEVGKGECLGIVGRNGAGKSTLLQLITGTLQPSRGKIAVRGRVAALLELGSGFNPEFTGRENVFLNASILGLTQRQIEERFDDILRFAEIGAFIEEPVKVYSSGMAVRLAFAVVAHVDADVMIIDEALSVGDARFQLKCARAIDQFIERGTTMLFVSHDMSMVKRLCNRAMLIEGGRSIYTGRPNTVVNLYSKLLADGGSIAGLAVDLQALQATAQPAEIEEKSVRPDESECADAANALPTAGDPDHSKPAPNTRSTALLTDERSHVQVSGHEYSYGGDLGWIHGPELCGVDGQSRDWFNSGEPALVRMEVEAQESLSEPIYALTIKDRNGQEVYGTNTLFTRQTAPPIARGARHTVRFEFPMNLIRGTYFISLGWTHFVGDTLVVIHRRYDVIKFEVHDFDNAFGIANLRAKIQIES